MLSRTTQLGEFYVMRAPPFCPKPGATGFMDIFIFDEEGDRFVRIGWEEAIVASGIRGIIAHQAEIMIAEDSEIPAHVKAEKDLSTGATARIAAEAARAQAANEAARPILEADPDANAGTLAAWLGHALWINHFNKHCVPSDPDEYAAFAIYYKHFCQNLFLVVCRPFIEHVMHSAIAMVAGRDTGATLFGPADMQISANTQVKTIEVSGAAALTDGPPSTRLPEARTRRHPDCRAGPLHWPLQVGRHQASERVRHARHRLWRVRRRRQRQVVRR
jgi:hypothetical protein